MPDYLARYMERATVPRVSQALSLPAAPRWPMVQGVFTFPWYLQTLAAWMGISFGLIVFGELLMFLWGPGARMGLMGVRLFGPPAALAGVLAFSYAAACFLNVIEETSYGWNVIETWPEMNWKEWVWSLAYVIGLASQAALVGIPLRLIPGLHPWLPVAVGTLAAFPLVLLGALAADSAWVPLSILTVLRSLKTHWRAWCFFYLVTGAMAAGWWILTTVHLSRLRWWVPVYSGPLLATVLLIYARLLGRLALGIAKATESED